MHMVTWALAVDACCLVAATEGFISLLVLTKLGAPGFEDIVVALSGLILVSIEDPNLGV